MEVRHRQRVSRETVQFWISTGRNLASWMVRCRGQRVADEVLIVSLDCVIVLV